MAGCSELSVRAPGSLSLYLHVPFCRSKCSYCDFFSLPAPRSTLVERVLEQIDAELECFAGLVAPSRVATVYVGGGTPSLLTPRQLASLLEGARRFVDRVEACRAEGGVPSGAAEQARRPGSGGKRSAGAESDTREHREWTVEINPESLTADHLGVFESHGVTRLSVGIQSFDDQVLATLGRPGRSRESDAALELLGRRWRGELSLDLLTGTPGQEWGSLQGDLDRAVGIAPHHVSLYSLSFDDPEHPLARRLDPDDQDRLWLRAYRRLEQRGYRNYEISNFARPGFECRHNLRYWYLEPYLGIGPGAASTLPGGDGGVLRLTHPRSLSGYLRGEPAAWGLETERVSPRELLLESLMMGLRLRDGVDSRRFAERFGADLVVLLPQTWRRLRSRRLLLPIGAVQLRGGARGGEPDVTAAALGDAQREAGRHALSFRGRMILDRLLEELQGEISELPEERLSVRWGE